MPSSAQRRLAKTFAFCLTVLGPSGCSSPPVAHTERTSRAVTLGELEALPDVQTPYVLEFAEGELAGAAPLFVDDAGTVTGFAMQLPRADGGGYLPENLHIDAAAGELAITTSAGIGSGGADAQDNQIGVGIPLPGGVFRIESTLLGPPAGSGAYEQAGLWFGISQRDFIKLVLVSTPAGPQIQAYMEEANVARPALTRVITLPAERVTLSLEVDPTRRGVRAFVRIGTAAEQLVATFFDVSDAWLGLPTIDGQVPARAGFAGVFATHRNRSAALGPLRYRFADFSVRRRTGLPDEPDITGSAWAAVPALGELTFANPTGLAEAPGTGHLFVLEREGRIQAVSRESPVEKKLVLDISRVTQGNQDLGLLGIAFHPQFGQRGSPNGRYMYLHYAHADVPSPVPVPLDYPTDSRLSRFEVDLDSLVADPASEQVLISQSDEQLWHQGGGMYFDADDGFLYLSVGDEGDSRCRLGNCQRIDKDLFSGVLRIDVDQRGGDISHPIPRQPESGFTESYFIPNDNPFVGREGVLEEFFAIGLRSPHRMTHDEVDDITWIGDVGQNLHEELDVLRPGANFQWNFLEGSASHLQMSEMPIGVWTDPVLELERRESVSVIGGSVYRGSAFPELYGRYIFGDFFYGSVWALDYTYDGEVARPLARELLLTSLLGKAGTISSFGVDLANEIYILVMGGAARIQRLTRGQAADALPERLSRVGAFEDLATLEPIAGFEPYDVQSPLWSDGASKQRWIGLPPGEQIRFVEDGAWQFPQGTLFVKHFEMALDEREPEQRRRLETRFLVAARDGRYYGVTYKWSPDGTDAVPLLESEEETLSVVGADGLTREQVYFYPGPSDCMLCHNAEAGYVLGVRTAQLNGPGAGAAEPGRSQLVDWAARGLLDTPIDTAEASVLPRLSPLSDAAAPLEERVRSYWDSNCSMCHGAVGSIRSTWDARYSTPLAGQGVLFGNLSGEAELPAGSFVAVPSDLEHSALWQRARSNEPALRMPPLGRRSVDTEYVQLLEQWLASL
jgi:glucose/arabinose dehydrogenase